MMDTTKTQKSNQILYRTIPPDPTILELLHIGKMGSIDGRFIIMRRVLYTHRMAHKQSIVVPVHHTQRREFFKLD